MHKVCTHKQIIMLHPEFMNSSGLHFFSKCRYQVVITMPTHTMYVSGIIYCKSLKHGVNIIQRKYGTALDSVI